MGVGLCLGDPLPQCGWDQKCWFSEKDRLSFICAFEGPQYVGLGRYMVKWERSHRPRKKCMGLGAALEGRRRAWEGGSKGLSVPSGRGPRLETRYWKPRLLREQRPVLFWTEFWQGRRCPGRTPLASLSHHTRGPCKARFHLLFSLNWPAFWPSWLRPKSELKNSKNPQTDWIPVGCSAIVIRTCSPQTSSLIFWVGTKQWDWDRPHHCLTWRYPPLILDWQESGALQRFEEKPWLSLVRVSTSCVQGRFSFLPQVNPMMWVLYCPFILWMNMRPESVNMSVFTLISKIEILIKSLAKSYGYFFF